MRWVLCVGLGASAVVSLIGAFGTANSAPASAVLMLAVAAAFGWFVAEVWRAPGRAVRFDGARLIDDAGAVLCTLDQIESVDRGFALWKPSGGFVILLKTPQPRGWSPGLWWRIGRRVGVGGATPGKAGAPMADAIAGALAAARRDD